jgi:hypothetical protein
VDFPAITSNSLDNLRSGVNVLIFWAFLQSRPGVQTVAGTSGDSNDGWGLIYPFSLALGRILPVGCHDASPASVSRCRWWRAVVKLATGYPWKRRHAGRACGPRGDTSDAWSASAITTENHHGTSDEAGITDRRFATALEATCDRCRSDLVRGAKGGLLGLRLDLVVFSLRFCGGMPRLRNLDDLSSAELKALVLELLTEVVALKEVVRQLRAEIARLIGLQGPPTMKPSVIKKASDPRPAGGGVCAW